MKKIVLLVLAIALVASTVACSRPLTGSVTLAASASPARGDATRVGDTTLASPINAFGFDLLRAREANPERGPQTVISPLSVHAALAMTANGASAETLAEMRKVLHLDDIDEAASNAAYADLIARMNAATDVKLAVANSLWLDEGFPMKKPFLDADQQYFGAEMHTLDLQSDTAWREINSWVSTATAGKIPTLLDEPLPDLTVLDLINATYFKGDWEEPFEADATSDQAFHLVDGSTVNVPTMHSGGEWDYAETSKYQAIRLPYKGRTTSMVVVLPRKKSSLDELIASLTAENFASLEASLTSGHGALALSKTEVRWDGELSDDLSALGMPAAFSAQTAQLSRMSDSWPLWISSVLHKTYLRVDEKGTEAAAVTSVQVAGLAAAVGKSFEMTVDRPYLMAIVDDSSGAVLFLATVRDPRGK